MSFLKKIWRAKDTSSSLSNKAQNDLWQIEISEIESYFSNSRFIEFINNYYVLLKRKNSQTCFTYWGINFKNDQVYSIKFYAHITDELTTEEILQFIPTSEDFVKHLPFKSNDKTVNVKSAGTALELKFKIGNKAPCVGFFYHLEKDQETFNHIGFPKNLPTDFKDTCIAAGVNYEYENGEKTFKRYYYFNHPDNRSFFEEKFNVSLIKEARLVEYSESDSFAKINAYGNQLSNTHEKAGTFSDKQKSIISYFNNKYGLINLGYGIYVNQPIRSVYFFDAESNINPAVCSNAAGLYQVNTLNKLINE